jgi:uncharacterized protein
MDISSRTKEAPMNCPGCRVEMNRVRCKEIDIDFCDSCRGIWLDGGEMEKLLEAESFPERLASIEGYGVTSAECSKEGERQCPHCKTKMGTVSHKGLSLDHCNYCSGTWFDAGELPDYFQDKKRAQAAPPPPLKTSILDLGPAILDGVRSLCLLYQSNVQKIK